MTRQHRQLPSEDQGVAAMAWSLTKLGHLFSNDECHAEYQRLSNLDKCILVEAWFAANKWAPPAFDAIDPVILAEKPFALKPYWQT